MKLSITGLFKRHVKEEKKPQNIDAGQEKEPASIIQTDIWKKPSSDGLVDYHAVTGEGTPEYQERQNSLQQMEAWAKENQIPVGKRTVTDYYYDSKIVPGRVVLMGLGKNVRGSMQYILNELNHNDAFKDFHIYVKTAKDTEEIVKTYIRQNGWNRTEAVTPDSVYMELIETAQFLLTEVYLTAAWVKKEGQMYINIWHGTPLKKLGLAKNAKGKHKNGIQQSNFIDADYLLYPNDYTKKHMLESYKVAELMPGKVLKLGYPRTGGMLEAAQSDQTELRKMLAPNGEHIYAYMPTWKDYLKVDQVVAESKELLDYLDANLREDQILYVNLHHRVSDSLDYSQFKRIRQFPPTVDSYKLLALTDALITDYSSVFYDYLALRRQIVLYCADYELYRKKRGTYMDLMELPFDKAVTPEEVLAAINRGKTYDDEAAYQEFCAYDSVENAHKLCSLFLGTEDEVVVEAIPKNKKKKVMIYSDALSECTETQWLRKTAENCAGSDTVELFISCNQDMVNENKDSAYPLLNKVPVIGTTADYFPSAMGRTAKKLYESGKITIGQAMSIWKYDYAAAVRRFLGRAAFDLAVLLDVTDPEKLLSLTFMDQPNKIMIISDLMYKEITENNNTFLKDALQVSASYMRAVFVKNEEQYAYISQMIGDACPVCYMKDAKDLTQAINAAVIREGE
jgi:CDP-glycerol glycerophosphotransferase